MILEFNPLKWGHHKEPAAPEQPSRKITTREDALAIGPVLGVIPSAHLDSPRATPLSVPRAVAEVHLPAPAGDHQPASALEVPPQLQENHMENTPAVPTSGERQFRSVMEHLLKYATLGLEDVIRYAPPVEILAQTLFPEYALVERSAQVIAVQVATLLLKAVISSQQKYAAATKSHETNAAKLADVLSTVEPVALSLLVEAGFAANSGRVQYAVEAIVAILKTTLAPVVL